MNNIEKIFKNWTESHNEHINYGPESVKNIIVNCVSLSKTWFDRDEEKTKASYELMLFNKEGIVFETLHGITRENLPETMVKTITDMNEKVSKICLNSFSFKDGKKNSKTIGELEIS